MFLRTAPKTVLSSNSPLAFREARRSDRSLLKTSTVRRPAVWRRCWRPPALTVLLLPHRTTLTWKLFVRLQKPESTSSSRNQSRTTALKLSKLNESAAKQGYLCRSPIPTADTPVTAIRRSVSDEKPRVEARGEFLTGER